MLALRIHRAADQLDGGGGKGQPQPDRKKEKCVLLLSNNIELTSEQCCEYEKCIKNTLIIAEEMVRVYYQVWRTEYL